MHIRKQVFAAACIGLLLFGIILITLGSILPSLSERFQMNEISSGKLISILPIGIIAGSLVFGPIADRYGYKMMFILTTLLMTGAIEGLAFANTFFILQVSIFVLGFGGGVINGATNAVVADISTAHKEAHLSLLGVFFGIGALGMPLVLGILSKQFEYPVILSSVGGLMLFAVVYFSAIRFPAAKHQQGLPFNQVFKLLVQPGLILTSFFLFFQSGIEGLINNWTTTFFQKDIQATKEDALFALSLNLAGLTIMRLFLNRLLKKFSSYRIMIGSLILTAAGSLLLLYSGSYNSAILAIIITGAGFAAGFPVILGYIGQLYAHLSGTAFSIAFVIALTGNALVNYFFGFISNAYGIKQLPVCLLLITGCLFIILFLIKRTISSTIKM